MERAMYAFYRHRDENLIKLNRHRTEVDQAQPIWAWSPTCSTTARTGNDSLKLNPWLGLELGLQAQLKTDVTAHVHLWYWADTRSCCSVERTILRCGKWREFLISAEILIIERLWNEGKIDYVGWEKMSSYFKIIGKFWQFELRESR